MDRYNELRNKYPIFIYDSYDIVKSNESITVTYNFEIEGLIKFNPTWTFPTNNVDNLSENDYKIFEKVIFNLGMVEVISYLKATCSKLLVVKAGPLTLEQINWYKKLYVNGLGEFFYRNNILDAMNVATFLEVKCVNKKIIENNMLEETLKGNLVPVGGGKDSALTLEVLKDMDNMCYIVNPRGASLKTAEISGVDRKYTPKRVIDKRLLELNKEGFLNGHTPFSAILAFSSYASAILNKRKYIVLSNEASANEANVKGTNINHQYSKSFEFENDFRWYAKTYMCENGPTYFSLLRPLTEWQIVLGFSKLDKYFKDFKSCNVGSKEDIWCENCPKCLYVYIMLKAFLDDEAINKIFKTNMLENENLRDIFNGLAKDQYDKPFECVGTKEEINLSLNMIISKYEKESRKLPLLLENYDEKIENLSEKVAEYMSKWNSENNLETEFETRLKDFFKEIKFNEK